MRLLSLSMTQATIFMLCLFNTHLLQQQQQVVVNCFSFSSNQQLPAKHNQKTFFLNEKQQRKIMTEKKTTFRKTKKTALSMNFFSDLGDLVTGGAGRALIPQDRNALPYNTPLCLTHSFSSSDSDEQVVEQKFAIRERALSFTGEDFDIYCPERNSPIVKVRGAMLHLPGKDKMRIESNCDGTFKEVAVLDRVLMAVTPTYDIYRGGMGAEKIGWIEKKVVSLTESFDIYMEGKGGFGPFKPPPAYEITGNFLERNFVMKNQQGEVVARFSQDGIFQFDSFNHYQVIVADGMDALLVLACACAIDEEMDEEHQEKKRKEADEGQGGGGWF